MARSKVHKVYKVPKVPKVPNVSNNHIGQDADIADHECLYQFLMNTLKQTPRCNAGVIHAAATTSAYCTSRFAEAIVHAKKVLRDPDMCMGFKLDTYAFLAKSLARTESYGKSVDAIIKGISCYCSGGAPEDGLPDQLVTLLEGADFIATAMFDAYLENKLDLPQLHDYIVRLMNITLPDHLDEPSTRHAVRVFIMRADTERMLGNYELAADLILNGVYQNSSTDRIISNNIVDSFDSKNGDQAYCNAVLGMCMLELDRFDVAAVACSYAIKCDLLVGRMKSACLWTMAAAIGRTQGEQIDCKAVQLAVAHHDSMSNDAVHAMLTFLEAEVRLSPEMQRLNIEKHARMVLKNTAAYTRGNIKSRARAILQATKGYSCSSCGAQPQHGIGAVPLHICTGCMCTRYCNTVCQRAHWREHKPTCCSDIHAAIS